MFNNIQFSRLDHSRYIILLIILKVDKKQFFI